METGYLAWLCLIIGGVTAIAVTPLWSLVATRFGLLETDRYKAHQPQLPSAGGVVVLAGVLVVGLALLAVGELSDTAGALLFTILLLGLFGLFDDWRNFGLPQGAKVMVPLILALPLALALRDDVPPGWLDWAPPVLVVILVCLYLTATANLHNMHAGYNGLSCGLAVLLLGGVCVKMLLTDETGNLPLAAGLLGATLVFLLFNRYPARVLEGDTGTYLWGAAVGGLLMVQVWPLLGLVMLGPHILDYLLWSYARAKGLKFVKFGSVDEDGNLQAEDPYKLKFAILKQWDLTESQATLFLWGLTAIFVVLALLLPQG